MVNVIDEKDEYGDPVDTIELPAVSELMDDPCSPGGTCSVCNPTMEDAPLTF